MEIYYRPHHCALSVRDVDKSSAFYSVFGFKLVFRWDTPDDSLTIVHLASDDSFILELFQYESNRQLGPVNPAVGNDLERLGVKHFAFNVDDLSIAAEEFRRMNYGQMTGIQDGRTGIRYFFVADPDGNWVEITQDNRALNPDNPTFAGGADLLPVARAESCVCQLVQLDAGGEERVVPVVADLDAVGVGGQPCRGQQFNVVLAAERDREVAGPRDQRCGLPFRENVHFLKGAVYVQAVSRSGHTGWAGGAVVDVSIPYHDGASVSQYCCALM